MNILKNLVWSVLKGALFKVFWWKRKIVYLTFWWLSCCMGAVWLLCFASHQPVWCLRFNWFRVLEYKKLLSAASNIQRNIHRKILLEEAASSIFVTRHQRECTYINRDSPTEIKNFFFRGVLAPANTLQCNRCSFLYTCRQEQWGIRLPSSSNTLFSQSQRGFQFSQSFQLKKKNLSFYYYYYHLNSITLLCASSGSVGVL